MPAQGLISALEGRSLCLSATLDLHIHRGESSNICLFSQQHCVRHMFTATELSSTNTAHTHSMHKFSQLVQEFLLFYYQCVCVCVCICRIAGPVSMSCLFRLERKKEKTCTIIEVYPG